MNESLPPLVHIAGIGGVGMSALAQLLLDQGFRVSGSDRLSDHGDLTGTLRTLSSEGVALFPQDGSGLLQGVSRLVISSAIEPQNPDLLQAASQLIPVEHRANALSAALDGYEVIAIAGTCGKSTVTAMLGHLLAVAGLDPLVVNGAEIVGWDANHVRIGSVRPGKGRYAVVEVDESDRSLLVFQPQHAVITNASADHFQLEETEKLFADFRAKVPGIVIDGRTGTAVPDGVSSEGWHGLFSWEGTCYRVPLPGLYNVQNAWYAVRMAWALGISAEKLAEGLATFPGVARRMQRVGLCGQAVVLDDYAHNTEKLSAAWSALADVFPTGICAVWRPHGYAPLRKMADALVEIFRCRCRPQDRLLLLPVYDAGGTADRSVNTEILYERLRDHLAVELVPDLETAEKKMRTAAMTCGALVTFGARDPGLPRLAARLAACSTRA